MYRASIEGRNIRTAIFCWFFTISYMGFIFFISSYKGIDLPDLRLPINLDKVIHMCAYIPLAFLFNLSLNKSGIKKYVFVVAFLFASIYGITDELHQALVPGRDAEIGDVLADSFGALLGSLGASFLRT